MNRPKHEVADIVKRFGENFIEKHQPNSYQLRVLNALALCRTSALGGHKYQCDHCADVRIGYNSCRNRHCPKCQASSQALWVQDRIDRTYDVQHYHIVFTVPQALNAICLLDSKWFYGVLFNCVWQTLRTFGYTQYGAETGAICVLHTWGQNLSLHPHIHCLVPALGYNLKGIMKPIAQSGKYLFCVQKLSSSFKGRMMSAVKTKLKQLDLMHQHKPAVEKAYSTDWVVHSEPSFGKAENVIRYLGQYTHRVAISNQRILDVNERDVTFNMKDYADDNRIKPVTLSGVEFLRRFCLHILPKGFVRIRHYGIYSSRFRAKKSNEKDKMTIKTKESSAERLKRLCGYDVFICSKCNKGRMMLIETLPRIRSPGLFHHAIQIRHANYSS
jgi:hypothetical protein